MEDPSSLENRVAGLEKALAAVSEELADLNEDVDYLVPNTLLLSDSLLIRSLAVWGHYFLGQLLVTIPLALLVALVFFLIVRVH